LHVPKEPENCRQASKIEGMTSTTITVNPEKIKHSENHKKQRSNASEKKLTNATSDVSIGKSIANDQNSGETPRKKEKKIWSSLSPFAIDALKYCAQSRQVSHKERMVSATGLAEKVNQEKGAGWPCNPGRGFKRPGNSSKKNKKKNQGRSYPVGRRREVAKSLQVRGKKTKRDMQNRPF